MNNFMLMDPTNETFQGLIGNSTKYSVPKFQRDYRWSTKIGYSFFNCFSCNETNKKIN
jgi:uncharacterized protein with ParB-like and HNH nuclease domain